MRRVLWVTGDTTWVDQEPIEKAMTDWLHPGGIVMAGDAVGADKIALALARQHGYFELKIPYFGPGGRAGGPMRNEVLAEVAEALQKAGNEVRVVAFGLGNGTQDSVRRALAHGLQGHYWSVQPSDVVVHQDAPTWNKAVARAKTPPVCMIPACGCDGTVHE